MIECQALLRDVAREHPRPLVFATISGAHLYGFPSADSDVDLRGVHLASPEQLFGLTDATETIEQSGDREGREIDLVTHEAKKFFRLMLGRNGYVLEQLFSPLIVVTTPEHEELVALGRECITRHHVHHYLGFARNQWDLFHKAQPPRVKPLLYVYRVLLTGIHLMQTGVINANLRELNQVFRYSWIDDLIEAKSTGAETGTVSGVDLAFHADQYGRLTAELQRAGDETSLPDQPKARAGLEALLLRLRRESLRAWSA